MDDLAARLYCKLDVVAISAVYYPHALDLLFWKSGDLLFRVAHEPQTSDATPVGETDMLAVRFQLPARLFVLDAPVIVLKLGIALLP